jgi:hypothetical protein
MSCRRPALRIHRQPPSAVSSSSFVRHHYNTPKTMTESQMRRKRDRMAEEAGEGMWRNKSTGEWCKTDVTFYPTQKLWITEQNARRQITLDELQRDYATLEL